MNVFETVKYAEGYESEVNDKITRLIVDGYQVVGTHYVKEVPSVCQAYTILLLIKYQ